MRGSANVIVVLSKPVVPEMKMSSQQTMARE